MEALPLPMPSLHERLPLVEVLRVLVEAALRVLVERRPVPMPVLHQRFPVPVLVQLPMHERLPELPMPLHERLPELPIRCQGWSLHFSSC